MAAGRAMAEKLRLSAETELDHAGAGPGCATSKAGPRFEPTTVPTNGSGRQTCEAVTQRS
jgi:hypothetical protein